MKIAIIPARGGSKRIPKKNVKIFCGKPMIAWSIAAAKNSKIFDRIIVSTDDEEISFIAKKYGAEVPFMRPNELANDFTPTAPVIQHAIKILNIPNADWVCCIYPCSPFILPSDLIKSLEKLKKHQKSFIYPIAEYPVPPQWALRLKKNDLLEYINPGSELIRSQDLEKLYFDVGQFYWGASSAWIHNPELHSNGIGYPIPNYRVIDIDTIEDWKRAEHLFYYLNNK